MSRIVDLLGPLGLVTQITSIATGVTLNARYGQITTFAADAIAGAENTFVLTNSSINPGSVVVCTNLYGGGGVPITVINPLATVGTANVVITNVDPAAAFDALMVIKFMVLS